MSRDFENYPNRRVDVSSHDRQARSKINLLLQKIASTIGHPERDKCALMLRQGFDIIETPNGSLQLSISLI